MMPDEIESAEAFVARLRSEVALCVYDDQHEPFLQNIRERDAAIVARARAEGLKDVREILAMHKYIGYERTDDSTLSDDPEMVEARLIEGLVQDLEKAVDALAKKAGT